MIRPTFVLVAAILFIATHPASAQKVIELKNGGFEDGISEWENDQDEGMSNVQADASHDGKLGLRVDDSTSDAGSSLFSNEFEVTPGKVYQARFWARVSKGDGIGVYIAFYDANGKSLIATKEDEVMYGLDPVTIPRNQADWKEFIIRKEAPQSAATGKIWIHSYIASEVIADFDEFRLVELAE